MDDDFEHLHQVEQSPKEKQCGKVLQLTDFFKPANNKIRNTLREMDSNTADVKRTSHSLSNNRETNVSCVADVKATKVLRREEKKPTKNVKCTTEADTSNNNNLVDVDTVAARKEVEEISYLDFLKQKNSHSDVDDVEEPEAGHEDNNMASPVKLVKSCSDVDQEMYIESDGNTNIVQRLQDDQVSEADVEPKILKQKKIGSDHLTSDGDVKMDRQDVNKETDEETEGKPLPLKPTKGCCAITSFFLPSNKRFLPTKPKSRGSAEVVVQAEVHAPSTQPTVSDVLKKHSIITEHRKCKPTKNHRVFKCNAVADNVDLTVTHLETVFVTLDDDGDDVTSKQSKHSDNKCHSDDKVTGITNGDQQGASTKKQSLVQIGNISLAKEQVESDKKVSEEESVPIKRVLHTDRKSISTEQTRKKQATKDGSVSAKKRCKHGKVGSDVDNIRIDSSVNNVVDSDHEVDLTECKSLEEKDAVPAQPADGEIKVKNKPNMEDKRMKLDQNVFSTRLRNPSALSNRTQVLSQTYKSTLLNSQKHKGTLKMKFTRVIDHDSDKESFTTKSSSKRKVNAANELLQKAKSSIKTRMSAKQKPVKLKPLKGPSSKGSTSKKPMRRSTRKSSHNASLTIQHLSEIKTNAKKRLGKENIKSKKPKKIIETETKKPATKRKQDEKEKGKSKQSTAIKIAPVFGKIVQPSKVASGRKDTELTEEEKLAQHKRDSFLRSGIPQTMKKHLATEHIMATTEYAPIPKISHVQQITEMPEVNVWHLEDHTLNRIRFQVRKETSDFVLKRVSNETDLATLTHSKLKHSSKTVSEEMSFRQEIKEEMIPYLLAEIATSNPLFPVHRVYKQLLLKKKPEINTSTFEDSVVGGENKPSKGKKRKNQIESETCSQRKRRKQVVDARNRCDNTSSGSDCQPNKNNSQTAGVSECHNNNDVSSTEHGCDSVFDLLWTEKYSPSDSSQLLGNSSAVKKIASWLTEWKKRTDLGIKQPGKKMRADRRYKEQSTECSGRDYDFDVSEDEISSDASDDDHLCNTMLITGPHSSGKTSIIYALAQELGYKVFEVNAASQRSGKQILSQLQEATQSHQVSKTNVADHSEISENNKGTKTEKKMSKQFTNFFKTPSAEKKEQKCEKDHSGKKSSPFVRKTQKQNKAKSKADVNKKECDSSEELSNSKKGLNLSSTSLIVFDEADLVFEEDKGFWFAIETFISTTKRPILLTATDPHFKENLHRKIEQVSLKQLTQDDLATYLQLVCLIENLRTSFHQLSALVTRYNSDIRQLLLSLQFWGESGGSTYPCPVDLHYSKQHLKDEAQAQIRKPADSVGNKSSHSTALPQKRSNDEVKMQKPLIHKSREGLRDTGSAKHDYDVVVNEDGENSKVQCSQEGISSEHGQWVTLTSDNNTPLLEDMVFYSVTGGCHYIEDWQPDSSGLQVFLHDTDLHLNRSLHSYYLDQGIDVIHANITQLLKLPKVTSLATKRQYSVYTHCNKPKITDHLEDLSQVFSSNELATDQITSEDGNKSDDLAKEEKLLTAQNTDPKLNGLINISLSELAAVFDAFSTVDSHLTRQKNDVEGSCVLEGFFPRSGCLISGQLDNEVLSDSNCASSDISSEVAAWISLGHVNRANRKLESIMYYVQSLDDDRKLQATELMCIPTNNTTERLYIKDIQSLAHNDIRSVNHAANKVMQLLSYTGPRTSMATDYLPAVRTICRSEQFRMEAGRKRRFLHYLNGFVNQITDSTLGTLCSSLQ